MKVISLHNDANDLYTVAYELLPGLQYWKTIRIDNLILKNLVFQKNISSKSSIMDYL
jgi:hypothetical protein